MEKFSPPVISGLTTSCVSKLPITDFFSLYFFDVLTLLFSKKFLSRLATFVVGFMSISLFLYKPGDLLTIKIFVYSSDSVSASGAFPAAAAAFNSTLRIIISAGVRYFLA